MDSNSSRIQTNGRRKELRRAAAQAFDESLDQLEAFFSGGGRDNWPGSTPAPMKPIEPDDKRWPTVPIRDRLHKFEQTPETASAVKQKMRSHPRRIKQ